MSTRIARLGQDPNAPFPFPKGTRVARINPDGTLDEEYRGEIIDGTCEYEESGSGWRDVLYVVKRADGRVFRARDFSLSRIEP